MRTRSAVVVFVGALLCAAFIPGPCAYDPHPELDCTGEGTPCGDGGTCTDGLCIRDDVVFGCSGSGCPCDVDADCVAADTRCLGGVCVGDTPCNLGRQGECPFGGFSCAFDPGEASIAQRFSAGVCRPTTSSTAAPGSPCPLDVVDANPCGFGGFCLPLDERADRGICVVACDEDGGCGGGLRCAGLVNGGGVPMCLPACDLDAPTCGGVGPALVCRPARAPDGTSACRTSDGACVLGTCDLQFGCTTLCDDGAECSSGSCVEQAIDNCRPEGPDQLLSVCEPP